MKILTIVGARPQFIKAAPVSKAMQQSQCQEFLVHTGQHYDNAMSQVFFDELGLTAPVMNLEVGSGSHALQTGQMLIRLEEAMRTYSPDWVLVYGDTNSTLAGALAAVKLQLPVAHVEAGLRSFNRQMPEEHNRVLTDHCADLLLCPTKTAVHNLAVEGLTRHVHWVGDTMYDAVLQFAQEAEQRSAILNDLGLVPNEYLLATVHRPYNTDSLQQLGQIMEALLEIDEPVIFPIHPRTRQQILKLDTYRQLNNERSAVRLIEPVGYFAMLNLERNARMILTDSGGVQKEAYFFAVPCITLRPETEWVETAMAGWNIVVGNHRERIVGAVRNWKRPIAPPQLLFGDGHAGEKIVELLLA
jgi:UDP-GlcNAc3NAcA epimerase